MPKEPLPGRLGFLDTEDNTVHLPEDRANGVYPEHLPGSDEFIADLNTKAGSARFAAVTVAPMNIRRRGGLGRQYRVFLRDKPQLRLQTAISTLRNDSFDLVRYETGWHLRNAAYTITQIAQDADVPYNDARQALWDFLAADLGAFLSLINFPLPQPHTATGTASGTEPEST